MQGDEKMQVLVGLQPEKVLFYFEEICGIPHGSGNTKQISDYLVDFANTHNLVVIQDDANNVIIFKEGTNGHKDEEPVILQGHMDMVCQKEADCDIDFLKDGIRLVTDGEILYAEGTTLGGDDGIAVAMELAILASDDLVHPPLECIFTVDEEIGLLGAAALDCHVLQGRRMINLDNEQEGQFLLGCAGGVTSVIEMPISRENRQGELLSICLDGLLGGHSGQEIDKGRGNANILMGRILFDLQEKTSIRLVEIAGGDKDNAIVRSCNCKVLVQDTAAVESLITEWNVILRNEFAITDPTIRITCTNEGNAEVPAMTEESSKRTIMLLRLYPNGVQRMCYAIPGLVQTSLNLGILYTTDTLVYASASARSSIRTEKEEIKQRLRCLAELVGGSYSESGDYPAWEIKRGSDLEKIMTSTYKELFGKNPCIESIHAGLECGLFAEKLEGLRCISIGPDMKDIHTTKEQMNLASIQRTWQLLVTVLERL